MQANREGGRGGGGSNSMADLFQVNHDSPIYYNCPSKSTWNANIILTVTKLKRNCKVR